MATSMTTARATPQTLSSRKGGEFRGARVAVPASSFSAAGSAGAARRPLRNVVTRAGSDDDKKKDDKKSSVPKEKVLLKFAIRCGGTSYGEQVCVVGNTHQLGGWDERRGVTLKWSEGDVWKGEVEVPAGGNVEYKLLIRNKHGHSRWEDAHNRLIQLYDGGSELVVEGRYGQALDIKKKGSENKNVKAGQISFIQHRFH